MSPVDEIDTQEWEIISLSEGEDDDVLWTTTMSWEVIGLEEEEQGEDDDGRSLATSEDKEEVFSATDDGNTASTTTGPLDSSSITIGDIGYSISKNNLIENKGNHDENNEAND